MLRTQSEKLRGMGYRNWCERVLSRKINYRPSVGPDPFFWPLPVPSPSLHPPSTGNTSPSPQNVYHGTLTCVCVCVFVFRENPVKEPYPLFFFFVLPVLRSKVYSVPRYYGTEEVDTLSYHNRGNRIKVTRCFDIPFIPGPHIFRVTSPPPPDKLCFLTLKIHHDYYYPDVRSTVHPFLPYFSYFYRKIFQKIKK